MVYKTYLVGQYEKIKKQSGHAFKGVSDGMKDWRRRERSISPDFAVCFLQSKPEHGTQLINFTNETGGQRE